MINPDFKEQMVDVVKALGQEVIDRAEDLVGDGEMMSVFDIYLHIPVPLTDVPTIEVAKEYASKRYIEGVLTRK